ncbi:MAG: MOSC domain-containing protein [Chloroflexi bacterium]|nr:MOSC domain-containing protein [Chloroflexota bacterium]
MAPAMVATVAGLYRFPVKSMGGESLERVQLQWHGFDVDRGFVFVKAGNLSRFPWLTARDLPDLVRYHASLTNHENTRKSPVMVQTPTGQVWPVDSPGLLASLERQYDAPLQLLHPGKGAQDAAMLSVIGTASVRALAERVGADLDIRRFRQNVVLAPVDDAPFVEESWVGRQLIVGADPASPEAARIRLIRRDHRCMIVNLDPELGGQNPAVLREIAASRENCLGLYATVEAQGWLQIGDPVYVA